MGCDEEEYQYQLAKHNDRLAKDPTNFKIINENIMAERMYQKIARLEREKAEAAKLIEEQEKVVEVKFLPKKKNK